MGSSLSNLGIIIQSRDKISLCFRKASAGWPCSRWMEDGDGGRDPGSLARAGGGPIGQRQKEEGVELRDSGGSFCSVWGHIE